MECRALTPPEFSAWDAFVASQSSGTPFHTSRWLSAVAEEFTILACLSGARIVAGMPVARRRHDGLCTVQQPPLTPYLGIVAEPPSRKTVSRRSFEKEVACALAAAVMREHDAVTMHFVPEWNDLHGFMWEGFSTAVRYTYLLDVTNLETVWRDMDPTRRTNIRRAEKEGIVIERSEDFEALLRLVHATFGRQGLTPRFSDTARRIDALLRQEGRRALFTASAAGEQAPCAAVYLVWNDRRAYYLLGGYDEQRARGGAHALAMWRAIEYAASVGVPSFDFEGSNIPQVEKYFRKFGGELTPYYAVSWTSPRARRISEAMALARLPLRAARRIVRSLRGAKR